MQPMISPFPAAAKAQALHNRHVAATGPHLLPPFLAPPMRPTPTTHTHANTHPALRLAHQMVCLSSKAPLGAAATSRTQSSEGRVGPLLVSPSAVQTTTAMHTGPDTLNTDSQNSIGNGSPAVTNETSTSGGDGNPASREGIMTMGIRDDGSPAVTNESSTLREGLSDGVSKGTSGVTVLGQAELQSYLSRHPELGAVLVENTGKVITDRDVVKSLIIMVEGRAWVAVLRGVDKLDEKKVAQELGVSRRRVRLATPHETLSSCGYAPGTVPPLGHMTPLPTLVDVAVVRVPGGVVYGGGGARDVEMAVGVGALVEHVRGRVRDVAVARVRVAAVGQVPLHSASEVGPGLDVTPEEGRGGDVTAGKLTGRGTEQQRDGDEGALNASGRAEALGEPLRGGAMGTRASGLASGLALRGGVVGGVAVGAGRLPLPWAPGSREVELVGVVAARRRVARLLQFCTLVPETAPCPPPSGKAVYLRRLWANPNHQGAGSVPGGGSLGHGHVAGVGVDGGGVVEAEEAEEEEKEAESGSCEVQLIMGKTLERNLGRDAAMQLLDQVKTGTIIRITGHVQPHGPPAASGHVQPQGRPPSSGTMTPGVVLDVVCHSVDILFKDRHHQEQDQLLATNSPSCSQLETDSEESHGSHAGQTNQPTTSPTDTANQGDGDGLEGQASQGGAGPGGANGGQVGGGSGKVVAGLGVQLDGRAQRRLQRQQRREQQQQRQLQQHQKRRQQQEQHRQQRQASGSASWPANPPPSQPDQLASPARAAGGAAAAAAAAAQYWPGGDSGQTAEVVWVDDVQGLRDMRRYIAGLVQQYQQNVQRWTSGQAVGPTESRAHEPQQQQQQQPTLPYPTHLGLLDLLPPPVGLDCEWVPYYKGQAPTPVALMQVGTRGRAFLVDLLAVAHRDQQQQQGHGVQGGQQQQQQQGGLPGGQQQGGVQGGQQSQGVQGMQQGQGGQGGQQGGGVPGGQQGVAESEDAALREELGGLLTDILIRPGVTPLGFQFSQDLTRLTSSYPWLQPYLTQQPPPTAPNHPQPPPTTVASASAALEAQKHPDQDTGTVCISQHQFEAARSHLDASRTGGGSSGAGGSSRTASSGAGGSSSRTASSGTSAGSGVGGGSGGGSGPGYVELLKLARRVQPEVFLMKLGQPLAMSLSRVIRQVFGLPLDKACQKSDWGARPLDAAQTAYAAADCLCLVALHDTLLTAGRTSKSV